MYIPCKEFLREYSEETIQGKKFSPIYTIDNGHLLVIYKDNRQLDNEILNAHQNSAECWIGEGGKKGVPLTLPPFLGQVPHDDCWRGSLLALTAQI